MNEPTHFLASHGGPLLFGVVFFEQIGLPFPTVPWLLGAGALWAMGIMNPIVAFGATIMACLLADLIWFFLGRHGGNRALRLLCRIVPARVRPRFSAVSGNERHEFWPLPALRCIGFNVVCGLFPGPRFAFQ